MLLLLGASTSYVERTNLTSRHMRTPDCSGRRFGLLKKSSRCSEGVLDLGRRALQPEPGAKDFERVERARNLKANGAGWGVRQRWRRD